MARAMMMKILMSIVASMMLFKLALSVDHTVGAPTGGWDTSTDLQSWASASTFTVDDNLVFSYTPNHNVLEVSKDDYDSCSTSNAISSNSLTPTTISLTAAGSRYFICGTPGHCDQGMKVEIKTVAAASGPPPTTTPPSTATPPSSEDTPEPPVSTTSPPLSDDAPAPPVTSGGKPVNGGETAKPSPSSASKAKLTVVSLVGIGFLMMI